MTFDEAASIALMAFAGGILVGFWIGVLVLIHFARRSRGGRA